MSKTLLEQLGESLQEVSAYNENTETAPVVLLWPDASRHFDIAVVRLRNRLPILTLGEFDEGERRGPAYWVRCVVAGTIGAALPESDSGPPVLYLPGVAREDLRAVEDCAPELAPIAELQYRGQWFSHPNGRDWTIRGFLSNQSHGLGLAVSEDTATTEALRGSLDRLLDLPMSRISSEYIDAEFLNRLLNPDLIGSVLEWLDDPARFRERLEQAQWRAFVEQAKRELDFDPSSEGEIVGGRLLGEQSGAWRAVWNRFAQSPEMYEGIETRLRKGRPADMFAEPRGAWPQDNEEAEESLRAHLLDLSGEPAGRARAVVSDLWREHRERRTWVWAKLGRSPLVFALEHLQRLGERSGRSPGESVEDLVRTYVQEGWEADDALLSATAAAQDPRDRKAVCAAATALSRGWIEDHALALQEAIGSLANAGDYHAGDEASSDPGTVTVFVDGLRLDLAHRLISRLGPAEVELETNLAALPTVTQTAKPVLTPVPEGSLIAGDGLGPVRATSGARADISVLRGLMKERGLEILQDDDTGDPTGSAWTEIGDIDERGHTFGIDLVDEIDNELDRIARRINQLLDAGWYQVEVVTDHGWILFPDELKKVELPVATTEIRKGRCARLKPGAHVDVPTVPWHWSSDVQIGLAPGISCFEAGKEFEHGGVSLQECIVPRLRIQAGDTRAVTGGAAITSVKWLGLMCRIHFENIAPGATVDIRASPADSSTSVAESTKTTSTAGKESLFVPDEALEDEEAYVVILSSDGGILAQREVVIGKNR